MTIKTRTQRIYTSQSAPLKIAEIPLGFGKLGLSLCPGKHGPRLIGGCWQRDLAQDLDVIKGWGAHAVVTLMETQELSDFKVSNLGACVEALGMQWFHLPIEDCRAPDERFERLWPAVSKVLHEELSKGHSVFIHCRGGLGRAGTVASLLLIETGASPVDAIVRVRAARPGAVETTTQEGWLAKKARKQRFKN